MARNLLRAGHTLTVYNRSREKTQALAGQGSRVAASPADACRDTEVVMTMVADDRAVEEIVFGRDGIASAMKKESGASSQRSSSSQPQFALHLGLKDLRLVLATADERAAPMPMASLVHDHMVSAVALGQAEMDWSRMARVAAREAGL